MEEPGQLVWFSLGVVLLQQEGQSDMGTQVNPVDGVDPEPC